MKNIILCFLIFFTLQTYAQSEVNENRLEGLSYEDKIAKQACIYLSKMDKIPDPQQAIVKSIIKAKNKVHEEDVEKKYKRDFTVEGIRGLNKTVTDLLIEKCKIVSKKWLKKKLHATLCIFKGKDW